MSILFITAGCVSDKAKNTEKNSPIFETLLKDLTVNEAVKAVLANNTTYDTAKKNITQAYSSYFKSISDLLLKESSESSKTNQLQNIKAAEKA